MRADCRLEAIASPAPAATHGVASPALPAHDVSAPRASGWVAHPVVTAGPRLCLVILPCAGGAPVSLVPSPEAPGIDVWPVQLPGHGARLAEPPLMAMRDIVDHVFEHVLRHVGVPLALFGHSLGALVAFDIARQLALRGTHELVHLFVAGCRPPHCRRGSPRHELSRTELLQEIVKLAGTPPEIIDNDDLAGLIEPVLRAELRIYWEYAREYSLAGPVVACGITALGGIADEENTEPLLREWERYTTGACRVRMFDGGHFFVQTSRAAVAASVMSTLAQAMSERPEVRS